MYSLLRKLHFVNILFLVILSSCSKDAVVNTTPVDYSVNKNPIGINIGEQAPNFKVETPSRDTFDLKSLRGKVVLLDYWATWCIPCQNAVPEIRNIYNKYKNRGFTVLSVSVDNSKSPWLEYVAKNDMPWLNGYDINVSQIKYNVAYIPSTWLLDRYGTVIAVGGSYEQLDQQIEKALK